LRKLIGVSRFHVSKLMLGQVMPLQHPKPNPLAQEENLTLSIMHKRREKRKCSASSNAYMTGNRIEFHQTESRRKNGEMLLYIYVCYSLRNREQIIGFCP
jgi:hypothetical protein